ncbi:hypothetical protein [Desulfovibrio inopinatus]|uniref:hypothetical protein n=1 Tax=Desulfovibrio inopinatus TaxID=102109 RepID=UPI0012EBC245|nr:hypothetical protein [Desulfovibrio inopinatus]
MPKLPLLFSVFGKIAVWGFIAFVIFLISYITYKNLYLPLDYDEAYNLQVVDSFARGDGYASYGVLHENSPQEFDSNVTTGPVILVPLAAVWALTDGSILAVRTFMASFLWIYAAGLFLLLRRLQGGMLLWSLSIAALLCIHSLPVGKVEGELPAAAALILAAALLSRKKILLAALAVGIAIQIKIIFGLAGVILLSTVFVYYVFLQYNLSIKHIVFALALILTPTLAFEFFRYCSLHDIRSYLFSIDEFRSFLRMQNVNNTGTWLDPQVLGVKISGLYQCIPSYTWGAAGLATIAILVSSSIQITRVSTVHVDTLRQDVNKSDPFVLILSAVLLMAGGAMLLGWLTQSKQAAARQAFPFLFLFMPALFILGASFFIKLREDGNKKQSFVGTIFLLSIFILSVGSLVSVLQESISSDFKLRIDEQLKVVSSLKKAAPKSLFADGWWQNPEYQLLTGIPTIPFKTGDSQVLVVQDYQVRLLHSDWDSYKRMCSNIIYSSPWNLVCWLPDRNYNDVDFKVLDWGPQNTEVGSVPNEQVDGGAGIWIKIQKLDPLEIGNVKVYFGDTPSRSTYQSADGELITASIPPRLFDTVGSYEITVQQMATKRHYHVGVFTVK